jgi:hypothetical protein
MALALDTLEASKRLKSAGFDETQAEALVGVLRDTREAELAGLATRDELLATKNELKAEITQLAAAMNTGFAALRGELEVLRREMEIIRRDITIRLGGMIVVATGILLATKFFG